MDGGKGRERGREGGREGRMDGRRVGGTERGKEGRREGGGRNPNQAGKPSSILYLYPLVRPTLDYASASCALYPTTQTV